MWVKLRSVGLLRNMLHGLAVIYILLLPFAEPARVLVGSQLFWGGILPATAPLVFVVMMFDLMMCKVLRGDADEQRKLTLDFIVRLHLILGLTLISLWLFSFRSVLLN